MPLIDISRTLHPGMPVWPGDRPFSREASETGVDGYRCVVSHLALSAHLGTHVDAPTHLMPPDPDPLRVGVDLLPLDVLVGPARVADLRGADSIEARSIHALPPGPPRLLLRTDNSHRPWSMNEFCALTPEAAEALVSRAVLLVGVDGPSVDPADSDELPAHRILLDAGVTLVEGLDLSRAAPGDYELLCLPLKVRDGEAAPARVVLRRL